MRFPARIFFITSKIWNNAQRLGDVDGAFYRSLERLKLDYLDLYLIHWPVPGCYTGTWLEMAKLLETGRVLSIGVSNFQIHHLEELKKVSGIVPCCEPDRMSPLCYPKGADRILSVRGHSGTGLCPVGKRGLP